MNPHTAEISPAKPTFFARAQKKSFNDEWVAVLDKTIVDHDRDLDKLVKRLRKKHPKAYSQIPVEYITTKEIELIL